ncbi:YdeI/OmpD-associated family protein [Georgenia halophila]|uniref:YdeI/OmpD-associated family protein n=1 Tax=Georgenia halophila TaxID=620889 RepID=A0ABP8L5U4_9MICO
MIGTPGGSAERPAIFFSGPEEFRAWLEENHETATELWMGLRKKGVLDRGLTWAEAVPEALCFGWIDSVAQGIDETTRRQRWTPRKPTSTWSRVNVAIVERLITEDRMHPAGLAAFERRRPDREGIYSYEQDGEAALPPSYTEQLAASPAATAFWDAATPSYRRICVGWVLGAKQAATRDRRMTQLVEDSANGRLVPFQRYGKSPAWLTRAAAAAAEAGRP